MNAMCAPALPRVVLPGADLRRLGAVLWAAVHALRPADRAQTRETDEAAAERLLDTYGNAILRLAWSYLHGRGDAEEILQDTVLRYLDAKPRLESPAHEKAWLLRVAANLSRNRIDYNRLRAADELNETLCAAQREDLSFVWDAVKSLPTAQREAIHLYYEEGYSTAEIAKILGRNESSVRSDLRRGREKLREILKEAYDFG